MEPFNQFLISTYWAVQTETTVGFGDIVPGTYQEKLFAIFALIIGVWFHGFVLGNFISRVQQDVKQSEELEKQLQLIKDFSKEVKLPYSTILKLKTHVRNSEYQKKLKKSEKLLSFLEPKLRNKVIQITHRQVFQHVEFFKNRSVEFISLFVHELKPIMLHSRDILYSQGDQVHDIFFISEGSLLQSCDLNMSVKDEKLEGLVKNYIEMINEHDEDLQEQLENDESYQVGVTPISKLNQGNCIGICDVIMIMNKKISPQQSRALTVTSSSDSQLFRMKDQFLIHIKEEFPEIFNELELKAERRFEFQ